MGFLSTYYTWGGSWSFYHVPNDFTDNRSLTLLQCGGMGIRVSVSVRGTVIYGSEVIGMLVSVQGHGNMSVSMGNVVCGGGIVV